LLRLSLPRYLALCGEKVDGVKELVKIAILREIFLAGSLMKSEISTLLAR